MEKKEQDALEMGKEEEEKIEKKDEEKGWRALASSFSIMFSFPTSTLLYTQRFCVL